MLYQKKFLCEMRTKVIIITVGLVAKFTVFYTGNKSISANVYFPEIESREDKPSTPTEEMFAGQFSTNASDLLATPQRGLSIFSCPNLYLGCYSSCFYL